MDKYKDLPEIIADLLIKQDQIIDAVNRNNEKIDGTNSILQNFMEVSIKQWDEQAKFNERLYSKLDHLEKTSEKTAETLTTIEESIQRLENR